MKVALSLKEKNVTLVLNDDVREVDRIEWTDGNDLLEKFFPAIELLMERNHVAVGQVEDFSLTLDIPKGYTTARIARTIIKTLNFARHAHS